MCVYKIMSSAKRTLITRNKKTLGIRVSVINHKKKDSPEDK